MTTDLSQYAPQAASLASWSLVRLGDNTTKVGSGFTPLGGFRSYAKEGVPLIRSQNVRQNRFVADGLVYVSPDIDLQMVGSRVLPNDVLLNITGASIGRACVAPAHICPANVNQHVSIIRCNDALEPEYLSYYLNSPQFQKFILDSQAGATRQALTKNQIEDFLIPAPPIAMQRRIAAMLNEQMGVADRLRATTRAQAQDADRLEAGYFRGAFRGITPLSDSDVHDEAPEGWRWRELADLARLESGHTPSRNRPDWWGGGVPWLALPDIREADGKVIHNTIEHTNQLGLENSSARLLPKGTVCLSRTASVGFVTVLGRPMATSQDFVNWICGPDLDPMFLAHLLRASRRYIRSLSSGAIHKTVYVPTVKAFRVCVPDLGEQRRIAAYLSDKLDEANLVRVRVAEAQNALERLPGAVLRRAFRGDPFESSL